MKNKLDEAYEESDKEHEDHEISCAADKLLYAEEVKADSKLHAAAVEYLKKQQKQIGKITSIDKLKSVAKEKIKEKDEGYEA